ncbi:hypothetical protein PtB15_4B627 [Puccinia triticina]|nr:hypothetical protein PtB15_4B627 [Puccinia triticina]
MGYEVQDVASLGGRVSEEPPSPARPFSQTSPESRDCVSMSPDERDASAGLPAQRRPAAAPNAIGFQMRARPRGHAHESGGAGSWLLHRCMSGWSGGGLSGGARLRPADLESDAT